MHPLADVWKFTRVRLLESHPDLNDEQLQWRPHENAHSIAEILFHIAGCEHYWASRLLGRDPNEGELESKLEQAARDGFLREAPCPFPPSEHRREEVDRALAFGEAEMASVIENPTPAQLEMRMISPIGHDVSGYEGLCRLAQHAGYHTGQIWVYRMDPRFPSA